MNRVYLNILISKYLYRVDNEVMMAGCVAGAAVRRGRDGALQQPRGAAELPPPRRGRAGGRARGGGGAGGGGGEEEAKV